jgi:hypothetical protein
LCSIVYEPPSHLRDGGGGVYLGRPKYIVKKKEIQRSLLKNQGTRCGLIILWHCPFQTCSMTVKDIRSIPWCGHGSLHANLMIRWSAYKFKYITPGGGGGAHCKIVVLELNITISPTWEEGHIGRMSLVTWRRGVGGGWRGLHRGVSFE